jgi:hypothetical protein
MSRPVTAGGQTWGMGGHKNFHQLSWGANRTAGGQSHPLPPPGYGPAYETNLNTTYARDEVHACRTSVSMGIRRQKQLESGRVLNMGYPEKPQWSNSPVSSFCSVGLCACVSTTDVINFLCMYKAHINIPNRNFGRIDQL